MVAYFPTKKPVLADHKTDVCLNVLVEYNLKLTGEGYLHLMNQYLLTTQKMSTSFFG